MVKSVDKTFGILEYLAEYQQPVSLGEISEKLSTNKSTVRRFMLALKKLGYVEQDPDSRLYNLSHKIAWLGRGIQRDISLSSIATPYMDYLALETGETINLGILKGTEILYIDKRESPHRLRLCVEVGGTGPIHATALGKSIIAHIPRSEINRLISSGFQLTKYTEGTISTWAELDRELDQVRREGIAYDRQELIEGLFCVGAPVFMGDEVVAAISISTPITRINDTRTELFIQMVRDQACKLSDELSLSRSIITLDSLKQ